MNCDLLLHAVSEAREHCGITGQNNVGVEVLPEVNITLQDEAIEGVADAYSGKTQINGMTESFSAQEPLLANGDHLALSPLVFSRELDEAAVIISCLKSRAT